MALGDNVTFLSFALQGNHWAEPTLRSQRKLPLHICCGRQSLFGIPLPLPHSWFIYSIICLHEHSLMDFKLLATIQLLHYSCCLNSHCFCSGHQGLLVGSCIPLIWTEFFWGGSHLLAFNVFNAFLLLSAIPIKYSRLFAQSLLHPKTQLFLTGPPNLENKNSTRRLGAWSHCSRDILAATGVRVSLS